MCADMCLYVGAVVCVCVWGGGQVAVASIKSLLISWPSQVFNGYMNQKFVPNCKVCISIL